MRTKNKTNPTIEKEALTVKKVILRFFIWLFTTALIIFIGIFSYYYITFKGPSSLAADEMARELRPVRILHHIPKIFNYEAPKKEDSDERK